MMSNRSGAIPYNFPTISQEEIDAVVQAMSSGWLSMGPKTIEFERALADYIGVTEVVCVNSCTAALHLALLSLDIGEGDEVITSPYTFAATGNVIFNCGATPVFVDINKWDYNIDPLKIEKAISKKTRAIMPVHYAGQPCNMELIKGIAEKYNLLVIEDAAHAIGAEYKGRKIGTFGNATCFSFYATKNMTTGEGGAIATNDKVLAERARLLRLHGISKDAWKRYIENNNWHYEIVECGWKYNMTDIAAALGIVQLSKLDKLNYIRRKYARIYTEELSKLEGVITPQENVESKHVFHIYPILLEHFNRDEFIKRMSEIGISCSVHFIPLHMHPLYKKMLGLEYGAFPVSEWVYKREVSLPLYPAMTESNLDRVITGVKSILAI